MLNVATRTRVAGAVVMGALVAGAVVIGMIGGNAGAWVSSAGLGPPELELDVVGGAEHQR